MQLRLIVLFSLFVVTGCRGSETSHTATNTAALDTEQPSPSTTTSVATLLPQQRTTAAALPKLKPKLDACAMLTSEEIESIQGEALKETKPSESSANGLDVSQCFFTLPTFTNSISLVVTQRVDGPGARDPRQFWTDTFHRDKEPRKDHDREKDRGEEEGESRPPQKISGIGDEAFWMTSPAAGILYVLKGSSFVRISIGGSEDQQTRIRKSKALARKVIDRL